VVDDSGDATRAEWGGGCGRGEQAVEVRSGAGARRKKRKGRKRKISSKSSILYLLAMVALRLLS
jgi:hypothetical protein